MQYSVTIDGLTLKLKDDLEAVCYEDVCYQFNKYKLSRRLTGTINERRDGIFEQSGIVWFKTFEGNLFTVDFEALPDLSSPVQYLLAIWSRVKTVLDQVEKADVAQMAGYRQVKGNWAKSLGYTTLLYREDELRLVFLAESGKPEIWASVTLTVWEVDEIRKAEQELMSNGFPSSLLVPKENQQ